MVGRKVEYLVARMVAATVASWAEHLVGGLVVQ